MRPLPHMSLVHHLPPRFPHDPSCLLNVSLSDTVMRDGTKAATADIADLHIFTSQPLR